MRYGAMNFPIRPVLAEIEEFAALGFDYLELTLDPPEAHHGRIRPVKAQICRALEDRKMGLVVHLPTFVSTADLTDGIRNASVAEMLRSMDLAAEMGAEKVVMHPSTISGLGPLVMDLAMGYAQESMETMIRHAESLGLRTCLENMFPRCRAFFEPEHFDSIMKRFSNLEMTLDTGHANIDGREGRRIFSFIRRFGGRIGHVHASDNGGRRDEHLPVGSGNIDFAGLMGRLLQVGYQETITLEVFSEDRRLLAKSRDRLRRLEENPHGGGR
ncbi:MAG: sugar phosphate isomerase/epimerase [Desulfobacterales bacterium]